MAILDENTFRTISQFRGFVDKPEITNLDPRFLVLGSQNVYIDYAARVLSRPGYILFGAPNNGGGKIVSSYEWVTSTSSEFALRVYDGRLEFYWNNTWNLLKSGYATNDFSFAKIWDNTEKIDVLKYVIGDTNTYKWSGGVAKIASSSNNTGIISAITSPVSIGGSGYMIGDILTVAGGTGGQVTVTGLSTTGAATAISIGFGGYGYVAGDTLIIQSTIFGFNGINPTCRVSTVNGSGTITGITLVTQGTYNLVDTGYSVIGGAGNGATINIDTVSSTAVTSVVVTVGGSGYSIGTGNAVTGGHGTGAKIDITAVLNNSITKQGVLTNKTTIAFNAGTPGSIAANITDSANNFLNAGFAIGDTLYVIGSPLNSNRTFTIASVSAGTITLIMSDILTTEVAGAPITLHNGEPTWATSRFLTTGTRSIIVGGIEYFYTGGEDTDTLIGLSAVPTVSVGDSCWQSVIITPNPSSIPGYFYADLIGVQLNQLILASTKSREVYISSTTDYTNFVLTSPRVPGDPAMVTMDDYCTCIVPMDNIAQTTSSVIFGGGKNEFFQLSYQLDSTNTNELVRMIKFKTANGSGLISKGAIVPVKNSTAYISREPAMDTLANVQSPDKSDIPLSDLIKNTFDRLDFTGSHMMYWKRAIYISVPTAGLVLIYDLMRSLWQPPWTMPIGRFAVIGDWLYGHSSVTNETYKLYTGTNDNGNFIPQVARFAYNNNGVRSRLKHLTQYFSDGYITPGAQLTMNTYFGFLGDGSKTVAPITMDISANNSPATGSPLGTESIGSLDGLPAENDSPLSGMVRFYEIDTSVMVDYLEMFVEYKMNTLGGQFAIISHGSNAEDSETSPVQYKN